MVYIHIPHDQLLFSDNVTGIYVFNPLLKEERRAKLEQEQNVNERAQSEAGDVAPTASPVEARAEATREPFVPEYQQEQDKPSSSWWNVWDEGRTKEDGRKK